MLDNSAALGNLEQLSEIWFYECPFITKLPETIVLLSNLWHLDLWRCEKLQELDPNSIRQLKLLKRLSVRYCSSVEALPECLGELTSLEELWILKCTSVTELPMSIGNLSRLWRLHIHGCSALQSFPNSLRQLNALQSLQVLECGSLDGLGLLRVLQGLRIWGCTSITKLPEKCLYVVDSDIRDPSWLYNFEEWDWVRRISKELEVVEVSDCGFLRNVQDTESGLEILQRVHKLPCCNEMTM